MSAKITALAATAILLAGTAFAAAGVYTDDEGNFVGNAPRYAAPVPGVYNGYYDYAPGAAIYNSNIAPAGYYSNQSYFNGVAPTLAPAPDPYAGTYFYGVAPW